MGLGTSERECGKGCLSPGGSTSLVPRTGQLHPPLKILCQDSFCERDGFEAGSDDQRDFC